MAIGVEVAATVLLCTGLQPCLETLPCMICLSPPPCHLLLTCYEEEQNSSKEKPLRPCLQHRTTEPEVAAQKKTTKWVFFADSLGLALTSVHHFSGADENNSELQLVLSKLQNLRLLTPAPVRSYVLGFHSPVSDYLDYRRRLKQNRVCLEHCLIQGRNLTDTVQVQNVAFEKKFQVHITFDLWQSFQDFPCCYLRPYCGGMDTDVFSFHIPLSAEPSLQDPAHFCISFHCDKGWFWDNSKGQNYPIQLAEDQGPLPSPTGQAG
uniref:Protein phosphatase 1 regulatory subunit 3C-like n=1 Tax=Geotrypetes seraphini TaxID=260995 RepID=A0A6P8RJ22_GEOSA|nr:protein phosphatase 1 regulatory subunit 3C-like [Geotrypetes seraphini]